MKYRLLENNNQWCYKFKSVYYKMSEIIADLVTILSHVSLNALPDEGEDVVVLVPGKPADWEFWKEYSKSLYDKLYRLNRCF